MFRKLTTKAKTKASRKGLPIRAELAETLLAWREQFLYRSDDDWMFASEHTGGRTPIWLDVALQRHIQPAAKAAGLSKQIGWHIFRRSLSSILIAKGESVKTTQELLRRASSNTTMELSAQGELKAKRAAQDHPSGLLTEDTPPTRTEGDPPQEGLFSLAYMTRSDSECP